MRQIRVTMEEHVILSMVKLIARAHQDTMARIVKQVSRENNYTALNLNTI